ncbi:MAG: hypothetical protein PF450_11805 [Bacteroidales bacterium]|jgi:hypothetical protein|nr:hypothetical protein [Bacteroidales bacterium]
MIDTINGRTINEPEDVILDRIHCKINMLVKKCSISKICPVIFGLVRSWPTFALCTSYNSAYEYLGHTADIPEGTARVYYNLGSIMDRYSFELEDVDMNEIASPYMLKHLPKAFQNHQRTDDVITALTTLSVRKFKEFAETIDVQSSNKPKSPTSNDVSSSFKVSLFRPQLREAFDADKEVFIIGVTSRAQWEAIKQELMRQHLYVVKDELDDSEKAENYPEQQAL